MKMKHKKHWVTLVCLVVGMLVLTTAVYANYDSAGGYSNYKEALKQLAFETNNVTVDAEMNLIVDGKEMGGEGVETKFDGQKQSTYEYSTDDDGYAYESYTYQDEFNYTIYRPENNSYEQWENYGSRSEGLLGMDMDDATQRKMVRFTELLADTFIGDLKNNVVLVSEQDGVKEYSVKLSRAQIPELVNAGLSLLFTASNNMYSGEDYEPSYVSYENFDKVFRVWYEEQTGEAITTEDFQELMSNWTEEFDEMYFEFEQSYQTILDENGNGTGMLLVKEDGSYVYYTTYDEYAKDMDYKSVNESDMMRLFGNDPYVESAICNVTLDAEGRLIHNYLEATLAGVDSEGEAHTATLQINADLSDYGTTVPDVFDPIGKDKVNR